MFVKEVQSVSGVVVTQSQTERTDIFSFEENRSHEVDR